MNVTKNVMAKTSPKNSILFVHSPRSASSIGLLLNSIHAIAPEHTTTSNKDMPVVQVSHAPTFSVSEYTAIITTQIDAATQNATVSTGSALRIRRPYSGLCLRCSCSLPGFGRYISRSLLMLRTYHTSCRGSGFNPKYVFLDFSARLR